MEKKTTPYLELKSHPGPEAASIQSGTSASVSVSFGVKLAPPATVVVHAAAPAVASCQCLLHWVGHHGDTDDVAT